MLIVYENSSFRDQTVAIFIVCTFYDCKKSASGLLQLCYPKLQLVQLDTWIIFRNPGSLSEDGGWSSPQEAWPASPRGAQAPGGWPASSRGPALEAVKQVAEVIPPLHPFKNKYWVYVLQCIASFWQLYRYRDILFTNILYTWQSLYVTKFIQTLLIRNKIYTGQSLYGNKIYT